MSSGVWAYDSIFNEVTSRHRRDVHVEHAPRMLRQLWTTPKTIIAVISAERVMYTVRL